jgi:metabolite-proton symporter
VGQRTDVPEGMTEREYRAQIVKAAVSSTIGTAIEWYDFFLYGTAAALVFPKLYFPGSSEYAGTLLAFSTYFVGFLARPIGAVIFGHYGDRIGRKYTLIITLLLMGLSSVAIGLVPPFQTIGIWAPLLLTVLRVLQGLGVGGEWGGSVLLAMEWGRTHRRGLMASWPQMGVPIGVLLSAGLFTLFNNLTGNDFGTWGWRIPFLLSSVLILVGLYIRGRVLETPIFAKLLEEKKTARAPVVEVLRNNPREVILSALLRTGQQAPFYIFITFVLTYGSATLGLDQGFMLNTTLVAAAISCFTVPFWGHVSDIVGRKRLYLIGAAVLAVYAFPYFSLLDTRSHGLVLLAVALSLPLHDIQYGPQAALIAESFPSNLRYSGASLGYQLASITSGGPAPLIATFLLENFKSGYAIATYMFACGVVTVIATAMLKDRSREDIAAAETYERRPAPA